MRYRERRLHPRCSAGDRIDLDTGSGDINVTESSARVVSADTGSGSILIEVDDSEEVDTDTGSGDVTLELQGSKLSRATLTPGSGDVSLKLARGVGFEMRTDVGSGEGHEQLRRHRDHGSGAGSRAIGAAIFRSRSTLTPAAAT